MIKKRHLTLLEVMIAFFLIIICLIPLVYPHTYFFKMQSEFGESLASDRLANAVFVNILDRLNKYEIPWKEIKEGAVLQVPDSLIAENGLPFKGTYTFSIAQEKKDKDTHYSVNLYTVTIQFENVYDKKIVYPYSYKVVIIHDPKQTGGPNKKNEGSSPSKEKAS